MEHQITIDGTGRLVVPKAIRDKLHLVAGTRLRVTEEEGRVVLAPAVEAASLVERDGFVALRLPDGVEAVLDAREAREERVNDLVRYALLR